MRDLLADLMDSAAAHADYADARHVRSRSESVATRNGELDEIERGDAEGLGVRVRVGGAWGFAATRELTRAAAEAALRRALDVARAQPAAAAEAFAPEEPARGSWRSPMERDLFEVPLEDKAAVLLAAGAAMRRQPGIGMTRARFVAYRQERAFASTEGALCDQVATECGGLIEATAVNGAESQVRS